MLLVSRRRSNGASKNPYVELTWHKPVMRDEAVSSTHEDNMRPLLLWLLGIPIPVIILLYIFHVL
jgi:hypothetical protein